MNEITARKHILPRTKHSNFKYNILKACELYNHDQRIEKQNTILETWKMSKGNLAFSVCAYEPIKLDNPI